MKSSPHSEVFIFFPTFKVKITILSAAQCLPSSQLCPDKTLKGKIAPVVLWSWRLVFNIHYVRRQYGDLRDHNHYSSSEATQKAVSWGPEHSAANKHVS